MNPGPETQDRGIQQELVLQQAKSPISKAAIKTAIPSDRRIVYEGSSQTTRNTLDSLGQALKGEKGNVYNLIFGMAITAHNETQLANAFTSMEFLSIWADFNKYPITGGVHGEVLLNEAQDEFLNTSTPIPLASDGARVLQAEFIGYLGKANNNPDNAMNFITREYSGTYQAIDPGKAKYFAEAYLLTILDPNTPLGFRKALLNKGVRSLNFRDRPDLDRVRFGSNASFWQYAKADWVYPDIFGNQQGHDVKDWEIAALRRQMGELQKNLEQQGPLPNSDLTRERMLLEQERIRLQDMASKIDHLTKEGEWKISVYKEIGGHPLEKMQIGYSIWKSTPHAQREELVRSTYRTLAKKYHYNLPTSDPKYDPLLAELANREFNRLNSAYQYLLSHKNLDEF